MLLNKLGAVVLSNILRDFAKSTLLKKFTSIWLAALLRTLM